MTADEALGQYLTDHLAGSVAGHDLATQIGAENTGTVLGELMTVLVAEIEEDQATLVEIMERLGIEESRLKQAAGREKLERHRLEAAVAAFGGDPDPSLL